MKSFKNNEKLGATLSFVGILLGFLALYLIAITYIPIVDGKILDGRPDEAITVRIVHAMMGWIGMTGSAIWAVALYGFLNKKEWAWSLGVVAGTLQLLSGFFPMIPPASIGMATPTLWVFVIAFILWFAMLFIGGVNNKIIALSFVSGLAYVMIFIEGVSKLRKEKDDYNDLLIGMYAMGLVVTWWAATAWVVFIYALVIGKDWTIPVGIFAASLSIIAGLPVGLTDVVRLGRFSMFLPGPLLSAILLVVILLPGTKNLINDWIAENNPA